MRKTTVAQAVAVLSMVCCASWAQAQNTPPEVTLKAVEVKGQALLQSDSTSASRTTLEAEEIRDLAVSQPEQLLARVPGMRVKTFGLGGVVNGISLRGFGSGAHGGDLGFVLDGISLNEAISHSDGYADLNVVIPLELQRLDVIKGPSSVLVGNYNRAGSIFLQTRKGGEYKLADVSVGSFGTVDTQVAGGFKLGAGNLNLAAQLSTTNDFRPQSGFDRATIAGRYSLAIDKGDISVSARSHRGRWDSASYLTRSQFDAGDPYGKDPRAQNDGGDKTFGTLRVDVTRELTSDIKALAYVYGTQQTYTRFFSRPINATMWRQRDETYDRSTTGLGFSLNGLSKIGGMPLKWITGIESTRESTEFDFYDGTTNRARTTPAVFQQNRDYKFNSQGAFAEGELSVSPLFRPTVGVRYDKYTGSCRILGSETVAASDPPCNVPLKNVSHTSPKIGVRSTVAKGVDLRASYNEGFQLANVRGLYSATNNTDPNVFKQKEIGLSLGPFASVKFDLAVFELNSDKEIRELPAGSGIFINSGQTRRAGTEMSLIWAAAKDWDLSLNYGTARTKIEANPNAALVSKQLSGIPRSTGQLAVNYAPAQGFGGNVTFNQSGAFFFDSNGSNAKTQTAYSTLDAGVTWRGKWGGTGVKARLAITNLTDKVYATNAFQIGGVDLVAPGAPRSVQVGMQFDF